MDPEILRTAILDRARAKLGLPSREVLAIEREKRAREEALQASNLETADVLRQRTQGAAWGHPGPSRPGWFGG